MDKERKIALVTGANRGIGFAVAKGFLQKDIEVIVTSRTKKDGEEAVKKLQAFGTAHYHQLDVTEPDSIKTIKKYVEDSFGRLDILVNNAGINYDTWQQVENAYLDEVRQTLETNTLAPWATIQAFLPLLKKSKAGRIVNVGSGAGSLESQTGERPGYSLSKLALNGLTLQFSNRLKNDGILVNSVCPGWVRTDMGGSEADRSPEEGAETIIWAALLENSGPTGKFFRDKKEIEF